MAKARAKPKEKPIREQILELAETLTDDQCAAVAELSEGGRDADGDVRRRHPTDAARTQSTGGR